MSNSAKPHDHFLDVAPTPWSTWGNCDKCGATGNRLRVRTCNYPGTASGGGKAIAVACPTPDPYVLVDGVLTQTETDGATCFSGATNGKGLAPYSDSCDLGKFNFLQFIGYYRSKQASV